MRAWFIRSGFHITLTVAVAFFAYHLVGELGALGGGDPNFVQRLERTSLDTQFVSRGPQPPKEWKVAVAAVDEKAIKLLGHFPWSRRVHARLTDKLTELGAGVIAFDVTFAYPSYGRAEVIEAIRTSAVTTGLYESSNGLAEGAHELRDIESSIAESETALVSAISGARAKIKTATTAIQQFRDKVGAEAEHGGPDEAFAASLKRSGRVVLGVVNYSRSEAEALGAAPLDEALRRVAGSTISEYVTEVDGLTQIAKDSKTHFEQGIYRRFFGVQAPASLLAEATASVGTINAFPDGDGVIRRVPLVSAIDGAGAVLPTLALQSVAVLQRPMPIEIIAQPDAPLPDAIRVGDYTMVTELDAAVTLDWYGTLEASGMPVLSIADIMEGRVDKSQIEGKIIFVAATALGTYDQRVTPLSRAVPGVYVHATLAQNILDRRQLSRPLWIVFVELLVMLAIGILSGLIKSQSKALGQAIGAVVMAGTWFVLNRYVFFASGLIVATVLPTVQIFVTLMIIALWRFLVEEREKRKTKAAFQRYLAPAVMEQVLNDPEEYLKLGGRRYEATVLFSDIRSFTTISEKLSPEELGRLLNEYMTPMTDLVFETGGTLDKYIGDAVMAFWGAPVEHPDHAVRACRTALKMMKKVGELNVGFRQQGLPEIAIGIGLSTGPMTIGNMGSDDFFAYTALGDKVNLGARLEGQTKDYGVDILISEDCYSAVKEQMACRELGSIRVKGKFEPVRLYQLIAEGPLDQGRAQFVAEFHEGLRAFRERRWPDAVRHFTNARERVGKDKSSDDYITLCREYQASPPPDDWDGVRIATSK